MNYLIDIYSYQNHTEGEDGVHSLKEGITRETEAIAGHCTGRFVYIQCRAQHSKSLWHKKVTNSVPSVEALSGSLWMRQGNVLKTQNNRYRVCWKSCNINTFTRTQRRTLGNTSGLPHAGDTIRSPRHAAGILSFWSFYPSERFGVPFPALEKQTCLGYCDFLVRRQTHWCHPWEALPTVPPPTQSS